MSILVSTTLPTSDSILSMKSKTVSIVINHLLEVDLNSTLIGMLYLLCRINNEHIYNYHQGVYLEKGRGLVKEALSELASSDAEYTTITIGFSK